MSLGCRAWANGWRTVSSSRWRCPQVPGTCTQAQASLGECTAGLKNNCQLAAQDTLAALCVAMSWCQSHKALEFPPSCGGLRPSSQVSAGALQISKEESIFPSFPAVRGHPHPLAFGLLHSRSASLSLLMSTLPLAHHLLWS